MRPFRVTTLTSWSGVGVPANGVVFGPQDTIDVTPFNVSWTANESVEIAIVQGGTTTVVGTGLTGNVRVTLPAGPAQWKITAGANGAQNVNVSAADADPTLSGIGTVTTVESTDGSVTVTNGGGPVVNLAVVPAVDRWTSALEVEITTASTWQTIVTLTPSASGVFLVQAYLEVPTGGATIGVQVLYTDADGAETLEILPVQSQAAGPWSSLAALIAAHAGDAIELQVQSSVATTTVASGTIGALG